ncbi:hypothetical protein CNMCM5623_009712 [Aspergillus felis]|uniref:Zn(2)-C6 fungal-type domain-containing protein n=1 Tax=Aspergillus felis TaxID=1287682 RepID=A0A8H6PLS1_9EURO|nr:hypothetical protein CNMCM5623_009712 [Aspergillus felis]KAF7179633.1 hypothetical protein CNMCM7691_008682 [Aspergillus felis]
MASDTETEMGDTAKRGSQPQKAACDECRRRKQRCDGKKPQCSVCQDTGVLEAMLKARSSSYREEHLETTGNNGDGVLAASGAKESALVSTPPFGQHVPLSPILHAEL